MPANKYKITPIKTLLYSISGTAIIGVAGFILTFYTTVSSMIEVYKNDKVYNNKMRVELVLALKQINKTLGVAVTSIALNQQSIILNQKNIHVNQRDIKHWKANNANTN